jgi:hypothetical protein
MLQNLSLSWPFLLVTGIASAAAVARVPLWQILAVLAPLGMWMAWPRR